jgi:hypothetical protein
LEEDETVEDFAEGGDGRLGGFDKFLFRDFRGIEEFEDAAYELD